MSTPLRRHRADDAERMVRQAQGIAAAALSETVRLRRALDALTLAVVIYDETGTLVLQNRQHGELETNRQVAALVTAAVERLVGDARTGGPVTETLVLHGPPPRTLDITAVPLDRDGQPLGIIAVVEDISERRRLEAVRRDFAANVSHEPADAHRGPRGAGRGAGRRGGPGRHQAAGEPHHHRGGAGGTAHRGPSRPVENRGAGRAHPGAHRHQRRHRHGRRPGPSPRPPA